MAITLDAIALPPHLVWTEEFNFTAVRQEISTSLTGKPIVQASVLDYQRPITLAGQQWVSRETLLAIYAKAQTPLLKMTLTLQDARVFTVLFRHNDTPVEARPVVDYMNPGIDSVYELTLRFITVPA